MGYVIKHLLTLEWEETALTIPWYVFTHKQAQATFTFERKGGEFELFRPAIENWLQSQAWGIHVPVEYAVAMKNLLGYHWVYVRPEESPIPLQHQFSHVLQLPTLEPINDDIPFVRHKLILDK